MRVPFGTTSIYLQLAKDIGNEKAVRAVANAGGLPVKKRLLKFEQSLFADNSTNT